MIHYHFRITEATRRHFAHHEITQDEIDCSLIYRIAVAQRLQPCPHLIYRRDITLQDLLLQWLCHLTIVFLLRTSAILEQAQMVLGLASVILIFLIFVSLNTITLFSTLVSCLEAGFCQKKTNMVIRKSHYWHLSFYLSPFALSTNCPSVY